MLVLKGEPRRVKVKCAICVRRVRDDAAEGSRWEAVALQCNLAQLTHAFHRECIEEWRSVPNQPSAKTCPVCRTNPEELIRTEQLRIKVQRELASYRNNWKRPVKWFRDAREMIALPLWRHRWKVLLAVVVLILYAFSFLSAARGLSAADEDIVITRVHSSGGTTLPSVLTLAAAEKTTDTAAEL
jgi:C3HC4-type zinc finger (RING finger) protein